jgi:hypothetical protein
MKRIVASMLVTPILLTINSTLITSMIRSSLHSISDPSHADRMFTRVSRKAPGMPKSTPLTVAYLVLPPNRLNYIGENVSVSFGDVLIGISPKRHPLAGSTHLPRLYLDGLSFRDTKQYFVMSSIVGAWCTVAPTRTNRFCKRASKAMAFSSSSSPL